MTRIYTTTFAATGDKETLAATDPGTGKVSLPSGWTPDYEKLDTDPSYRPVGRKEMNGVINEVTAAVGELQQYGFAPWQALTGGWPLNARVVSGGIVYKSTAAANTAVPPAAPWVVDAATDITAAPAKAVPANADEFGLTDSANSFGLVKMTWGNLKTLLGIAPNIHAAPSKPVLADADELGVTDSANSFGLAKVTWAQAKGMLGNAQILPISAVANTPANSLTISCYQVTLGFRSTTLGSGTVTTVSGTPANLVISSGSTLGTVNAQQSRIVVLAINNAGTIELAAVNIAGGNDLSETGLITTVAEGGAGAADSANVIYSTTARTSVAYRVIGYIESTQATAGTWATAPSTIQGVGGQALAALSSLGYGQTLKNVAGSRAFATTYYNTTGKPIAVYFTGNGSSTASGGNFTVTVNSIVIYQSVSVSTYPTSAWQGAAAGVEFIVPPNGYYSIAGALCNIFTWVELR